ncbi:hypothetical protein [Bacillus mycoides]|nr:hypothetical protein [Bacillus mycoides]MCQ6530598.1 hypothetical protein [Bacillus mycoides]
MKGKDSKLLSVILGSLGAILFLAILPVMYLLGFRSSTASKKNNTK